MKKKRTRREKFLAGMERVLPWAKLISVIEPAYPTSGRVGRQPKGVPKMLRMVLMQQWYGLADEALEDAVYDSQALRDFVGTDLSRESVPDATTLLKFRRLLAAGELTQKMFEEINARLHQQGLRMKAHIAVDAESGIVHSVVRTAANVNDVTHASALLHGEKADAFGDAGYRGVAKREEAQGPQWHTAMQPGKRKLLSGSALGQMLAIHGGGAR